MGPFRCSVIFLLINGPQSSFLHTYPTPTDPVTLLRLTYYVATYALTCCGSHWDDIWYLKPTITVGHIQGLDVVFTVRSHFTPIVNSDTHTAPFPTYPQGMKHELKRHSDFDKIFLFQIIKIFPQPPFAWYRNWSHTTGPHKTNYVHFENLVMDYICYETHKGSDNSWVYLREISFFKVLLLIRRKRSFFSSSFSRGNEMKFVKRTLVGQIERSKNLNKQINK